MQGHDRDRDRQEHEDKSRGREPAMSAVYLFPRVYTSVVLIDAKRSHLALQPSSAALARESDLPSPSASGKW